MPPKIFICPSGKRRIESTSPTKKSTSCGLSDRTFFARCWVWHQIIFFHVHIFLYFNLICIIFYIFDVLGGVPGLVFQTPCDLCLGSQVPVSISCVQTFVSAWSKEPTVGKSSWKHSKSFWIFLSNQKLAWALKGNSEMNPASKYVMLLSNFGDEHHLGGRISPSSSICWPMIYVGPDKNKIFLHLVP